MNYGRGRKKAGLSRNRAGNQRSQRKEGLDAGLPWGACRAYWPHHNEHWEQGTAPQPEHVFKIVTLLEISVDQYFYANSENKDSPRRKRIYVMLDTMNEKELVVMESTAEGLQKARETEVK